MTSTEKLSEVVSVRFTPSEVADLRDVADGRPISHVIRELAVAAARHLDRHAAVLAPVAHSAPALRRTAIMVTGNFQQYSAPQGVSISTTD